MKKILRAIIVRLQEIASNIHKIWLFSIRVLGDMVWRTSCYSRNRQPWESRHCKWVKSNLFVLFRRCVWLITDCLSFLMQWAKTVSCCNSWVGRWLIWTLLSLTDLLFQPLILLTKNSLLIHPIVQETSLYYR